MGVRWMGRSSGGGAAPNAIPLHRTAPQRRPSRARNHQTLKPRHTLSAHSKACTGAPKAQAPLTAHHAVETGNARQAQAQRPPGRGAVDVNRGALGQAQLLGQAAAGGRGRANKVRAVGVRRARQQGPPAACIASTATASCQLARVPPGARLLTSAGPWPPHPRPPPRRSSARPRRRACRGCSSPPPHSAAARPAWSWPAPRAGLRGRQAWAGRIVQRMCHCRSRNKWKLRRLLQTWGGRRAATRSTRGAPPEAPDPAAPPSAPMHSLQATERGQKSEPERPHLWRMRSRPRGVGTGDSCGGWWWVLRRLGGAPYPGGKCTLLEPQHRGSK